jgi:hypothetical protein
LATITNAVLESDVRLAVAMEAVIRMILGETFDLESVGIIDDAGAINGMLAAAKRLPYLNLNGSGLTTTAAEDTDQANSNVTDDSEDITVVRRSRRYDPGDLGLITGNNLNIPVLMNLLIMDRRKHIRDLAAAIVAAATVQKGTSGQALTVSDLYQAQYAARAAKIPYFPGGFWVAHIHDDQVNDLVESARGEGGGLAMRPDLQNFLAVKADGVAGFLGNTLIIGTDDIDNDATDHEGALVGPGALNYSYGDPVLPPSGSGTLAVKPGGLRGFMIELQRDASKAITEVVGNQWDGMTGRDERMIGLKSVIAA